MSSITTTQPPTETNNPGTQLALLIDLDRCIGCHACTVVCQEEHGDSREVQRLKVPTIGSGHHDIPAGVYPDVWMYFQPRMCQHCSNPPCMEACRYDAIKKREDGVVEIIESKCTGCNLCPPACPYDVIAINYEEALVAMCDMCSSRLKVDLQPACADACPGDAIFFGDINAQDSDINAQKQRLPKQAYVLSGGGQENDQPSGRYQSQKPQHKEDSSIQPVDD
ncbi:MAG: 4Fe-4S dicluster domain-containing protein [Gammaproteobacteria bacterium]|jgi:dimethyl sulfoxide reductase iron-sulfur subunit|nr:4Fe-4S dicluster domain-containing protein [Gammaproteobacteria bacterium]MBT4491802.1 4Fe-4S dicluster domain-containing protein [Gammaproteobacteria bacterium]MBT7370273.1 4Fe-4S dicluster domain-containing protein [Gammaproteobacteria bacterium]